MKFVGQGFRKLKPEQDRHTDTDRRDWTYYHAPFVVGDDYTFPLNTEVWIQSGTTDLRKILHGGQRNQTTAKAQYKMAKNYCRKFQPLSRAHERYAVVTSEIKLF